MSIPGKVVASPVQSLPKLLVVSPDISSISSTLLGRNGNLPASSTRLTKHTANNTAGDEVEVASESDDLMSKGNSVHPSTLPAEKSSHNHPQHKYRQSLLMICYAVVGITLAIAHHFYYPSLNGNKTGSATRQQWATTFGTAFSFIVIAFLKMAIGEAYHQYIWTLMRWQPYSLRCLDKLFALTSHPSGFLS